MTELLAAKLDHGLAALELDQLRGLAPVPGKVSLSDLAERAGVSPATVLQIERRALAKLAAGLLQSGNLPPHLRSQLVSYLNPTKP
jgi:transcriptional regulator with XRE-family HTH domain